MRRSSALRSFRIARFVPTLLGFALAGCASAPPEEAELPARKDDVTLALYRQLDLVLKRRDAIDDSAGKEYQRLTRLAGEIALRIARIDNDADVRALLRRIESPRETKERA